MSASPLTPYQDPALDAAALLRRLGFATLMMGLPVVALVSRRATVVLVPIGIALLIISRLIDGERAKLRTVSPASIGTGGISAGVLIVWMLVTLAWTPFPGAGFDKAVNILSTSFLALAGLASIPSRTRASNLYLMTVGSYMAALFAVVLAVVGSPGAGEGYGLERGLSILVIFAWAAIGWLASRGRRVEASALAALLIIAALAGGSLLVLCSILLASLAFGFATLKPKIASRALGLVFGCIVLFAPLGALFLDLVFPLSLQASQGHVSQSIHIWSTVIQAEPVRLLTGQGLDAALHHRLTGFLPAQTPTSFLFEIWYDLGLIGAGAFAACLFLGARYAGASGPLAPARLAALTAGFFLAISGSNDTQSWWLMALVFVILAFVAAGRGAFRTHRPKAGVRKEAVGLEPKPYLASL